MKAVELFNNWVDLNKDQGMEINHTPSVEYMLSMIPSKKISNGFSFLDIGCGNGWVVRKMSKYKTCHKSVGIDGAEKMIEKAKLNDPNSTYYHLDLNSFNNFNDKFDVILSMEVIYYLNDPEALVSHVFDNLLKPEGVFLLGLDHYVENPLSLSWPCDLDVKMCTYTMSQWQSILKKKGFFNVELFQYGQNDDWKGTLVLVCTKQ